MNVLVTGGAGYIGAHVVRLLRERGESPVVVDDLSAGVRSRIGDATFVQLDLLSDDAAARLAEVLREHSVTSVIHFAALKAAGESVQQPVRYYRHNVGALVTVLEAMRSSDARGLVFSSSAAVYGDAALPLTEEAAPRPINPYGETKLVGEWLVAAAAHAHALSATSLRYFNVAGAGTPELGDTSANNLIPMAIERIAAGEAPRIFGDDYNTPDGTCIRDYIHVLDIAEAHLAALDDLTAGHRVYNVGTGVGSSVREILDLLIEASGAEFDPELTARRPGDPDVVVATVDRIRDELGWSARLTTRDAVESAWAAHLARR
ncbi:MAG: UDP-glucose 4-epimerase GalE [Cryobacterium sp.]|nr:UDP-glucose 4-epimerase GalE [Cryobacterium sp.]